MEKAKFDKRDAETRRQVAELEALLYEEGQAKERLLEALDAKAADIDALNGRLQAAASNDSLSIGSSDLHLEDAGPLKAWVYLHQRKANSKRRSWVKYFLVLYPHELHFYEAPTSTFPSCSFLSTGWPWFGV